MINRVLPIFTAVILFTLSEVALSDDLRLERPLRNVAPEISSDFSNSQPELAQYGGNKRKRRKQNKNRKRQRRRPAGPQPHGQPPPPPAQSGGVLDIFEFDTILGGGAMYERYSVKATRGDPDLNTTGYRFEGFLLARFKNLLPPLVFLAGGGAGYGTGTAEANFGSAQGDVNVEFQIEPIFVFGNSALRYWINHLWAVQGNFGYSMAVTGSAGFVAIGVEFIQPGLIAQTLCQCIGNGQCIAIQRQ